MINGVILFGMSSAVIGAADYGRETLNVAKVVAPLLEGFAGGRKPPREKSIISRALLNG